MLIQSNLWLAAQELASIQIRYAKSGYTLSEAALCGARDFVEWRHYPSQDLVDKVSGYEFYYHAHSLDEMPKGEHGHFHLIKREKNSFHHLIGIALNQQGIPVRLFTTNQWVTGEDMADAIRVIQSLSGFEIAIKGRMAPVSRWINSLIRLFFVEIKVLIVERDQKIHRLTKEFGDRKLALDSKENHVLTERRIDLMSRLSEYLLDANS